MKRQWENEELIEHWILGPWDLAQVGNKTGATRLGFALLLKFFQREGRFPFFKNEIPGVVISFVATQVGVAPEAYLQYDRHTSGFDASTWRLRLQIASLASSVLLSTPLNNSCMMPPWLVSQRRHKRRWKRSCRPKSLPQREVQNRRLLVHRRPGRRRPVPFSTCAWILGGSAWQPCSKRWQSLDAFGSWACLMTCLLALHAKCSPSIGTAPALKNLLVCAPFQSSAPHAAFRTLRDARSRDYRWMCHSMVRRQSFLLVSSH